MASRGSSGRYPGIDSAEESARPPCKWSGFDMDLLNKR
jgi:hypothetical protein